MSYTTETAVYNRTGFNSATIVTLSGKSTAEVTTLVEGFISDAQDIIRQDVEYPIRIRNELHLGDGQKNTIDLGPEDDPYGMEGDYDPAGGLIEVYSCKFTKFRQNKPYPEDCDEWTEYPSTTIETYWNDSSNVTITSESTIKAAGLYSTKLVFSAAGSALYPETQDLDMLIGAYRDIFFWVKSTDKTVGLTIRLYNVDGTYTEEDITLRQNNVGQYYWIDIDSMTNPNSINWRDNSTRLQYISFVATGAVTVYIDNLCLADSWAFTAPAGKLQISRADNISGEGPPSNDYPYIVDYSYDPFLSSVPGVIAEAAEWLTGVYIVDYLRGIRYRKTSFEVFGTTLELDTDASREGLIGIRTYMMKNYWECLRNWGPGSYGVV